MAKAALKTKDIILKDAKRIVRGEKIADFINDPKQYFHRSRMGYYRDRYLYATRWLVNDEQQRIDKYYQKLQQR